MALMLSSSFADGHLNALTIESRCGVDCADVADVRQV